MDNHLTERLRRLLLEQPLKTVKLRDLESMVEGTTDHDVFFDIVKYLVKDGLLEPIKSQGVNHFGISYAYRIRKQIINKNLHEQIRLEQLNIHPLINLSGYFGLPEQVWERDIGNIRLVNKYLIQTGLPDKDAFISSRSYELVHDEKWIMEGGGRAFLERIGIYSKLRIVPVAEPLMFAINPHRIAEKEHFHLIVENKAVYAALSPCLIESPYTTLIYGSGKGFLSGIVQLEEQLNLQECIHRLYYFGDLDRAGISIWNTLHQRRPAPPDLAFYRALLAKDYTYGKQNQKTNKLAEIAFATYFSLHEQEKLNQMLAKGGYYPQEALNAEELQDIWRNSWKD